MSDVDLFQVILPGAPCAFCRLSGGSDSEESAFNAGDWVSFLGWEDHLEK